MAEFIRHSYKYFPYELILAERELTSFFPSSNFNLSTNGFQVDGIEISDKLIERLVYFSSINHNGKDILTTQYFLENEATKANRQSTRYFAHGLHEYKGKFNPQIVKFLLNLFSIHEGDYILDPFNGSGTSLLESSMLGINAYGADINPLAVFIANTKLEALNLDLEVFASELIEVLTRYEYIILDQNSIDTNRQEYLESWFDKAILMEIEKLKLAIETFAPIAKNSLLLLLSNLLRDYSLQDPMDLRIRRRTSPLPDKKIKDVFRESALSYLHKLRISEKFIKGIEVDSKSINIGICDAHEHLKHIKFDAAITSPPYATALPYIDTQRLSLVWLGLVNPKKILDLEAKLIGSREVRGKENKLKLQQALNENLGNLPDNEINLCRELQNSLNENDGFRRQAVPTLLYRYFSEMKLMFESVHKLMKPNAPFALVIGGNHTTIGGKRYDIDTPMHLVELAKSVNWKHIESIPLQTYQRYGYHAKNAVKTETLIILEKL